jgi:hypothetical protein
VEEETGVRNVTLTSRGYEVYRGFRIFAPLLHTQGTDEIPHRKVAFIYSRLNFHCPRKFKWGSPERLDQLYEYIDGVLAKDRLVQNKYEQAEICYDHVWEAPDAKTPVVQISSEMLIACMLGEFPIECPIDTVFRIRSFKGGAFIPSELHAEMISRGVVEAYHNALDARIRDGRPVKVTMAQVVKPPVKETGRGVTALPYGPLAGPHANLQAAEAQGEKAHYRRSEALQVREQVVDTSELENGYVQVITAAKAADVEYLIRRVYDGQGEIVSVSTSYQFEGPWQSVESAA